MMATNTPPNPSDEWTQDRLDAVIRHYEHQTEAEELAELEEAERKGTWVLVPKELVRTVESMVAEFESRKAS